jgi:hypothetical protein
LFSLSVRTAILRWNTTGITVAGVTDILGNQSNLLNTPRGITLDYSYSLYIADFGNQRVQKYLRGASSGTTVAGNGSSSSSPTQLAGPSDVVVDANKNIFVADLGNNRIQLWSEGATSGITVAGSTTGKITDVHIKHPFCIILKLYTYRCKWKHKQSIICSVCS